MYVIEVFLGKNNITNTLSSESLCSFNNSMLQFRHSPHLYWISPKFGVYLQDRESYVSTKFDQDHFTASWVMRKYLIGHVQSHQLIYHFRFWLIPTLEAYIPTLVKLWWWILKNTFTAFVAPPLVKFKILCRPLLKQVPNPSVNFDDVWTDSQQVMANYLLRPVIANLFWYTAAMFFNRSWPFIIEMCVHHISWQCIKFSVERVKIQKKYVTLLFLASCK